MAEKKIKETVREGKTVYLTKDGKEISEEEFRKLTEAGGDKKKEKKGPDAEHRDQETSK